MRMSEVDQIPDGITAVQRTGNPCHKQTCTRYAGRLIALSVEPFYNPSGKSFIGS